MKFDPQGFEKKNLDKRMFSKKLDGTQVEMNYNNDPGTSILHDVTVKYHLQLLSPDAYTLLGQVGVQ